MTLRAQLRKTLDAARRRPASLALAATLSLALHGVALAAILWSSGGTAPAVPVLKTIPLVMLEMPTQGAVQTPAARSQDAALMDGTSTSKPMQSQFPEAHRSPAPVETATPAPTPTPAAPEPPRVAPPPRKPEPPPPVAAPPQSVPTTATAVATAPPPNPALESEKPPRYGLPGLANPAPAYPWLSRRNNEEGRVVVRVAVNAEGRANDVAIARSSGHARLDRAALKAVKEWRFAPAERGGRPAPGTVEVPVTFRLTGG